MKNLLTFSGALLVASMVLKVANIPIANQIAFIELMVLGILIAKFSIDFMKNKGSHPQYFKYSLMAAVSFFSFSAALFTFNRIPEKYTIALLFLALLSFSMIGLSESFSAYRRAESGTTKRKGIVILGIFVIHALYAMVILGTVLKRVDVSFLVPIMIVTDLLLVIPYIFINKLHKQYILIGTLIFAISISLLIIPKEYVPVRNPEFAISSK